MRFRLLASAAPLLVVVACSSSGGDDAFTSGRAGQTGRGGSAGAAGKTGTTPTDQTCVPGAGRACTCDGGGVGEEHCNDLGSGYDVCSCAGGAGGSSEEGGAAGADPSGGAGGETDPGSEGGDAGAAGDDTNASGAGGEEAAGNGGWAGNPFDFGGSGGDGGTGGSPPTGSCNTGDPNLDNDGDGFSAAQGDCNDCSPLVNPNAFEQAGDSVDNDCDGVVDNAGLACDEGLGPVVGTPSDAAKAIGICNIGVPANPDDPKDRKWGLIAASFSGISGAFQTTAPASGASTATQLGILPNFGSATPPQEGKSLFALSSGIARAPGQAGAPKNACTNDAEHSKKSNYPAGFPKAGACGTTGDAMDAIALDMRLRAPANAKGFKIRFKFFTCEYPEWVCDEYNDVFAILMSPSPLEAGDVMTDSNNELADIAFESTAAGAKNVIGVNNTSFLTACTKYGYGDLKKYTSCKGESGLAGSGFSDHAASSWLTTTVPLPTFAPGADRVFDLRFAIWDSADQALDSSAVVDGFEWETEAPEDTGTVIGKD
jgi:hypothetical protein